MAKLTFYTKDNGHIGLTLSNKPKGEHYTRVETHHINRMDALESLRSLLNAVRGARYIVDIKPLVQETDCFLSDDNVHLNKTN